MAFTEFCCRSGGSNLNAGTLNGGSTEPGVTASFTYASGSWVNATGVFTVATGNPSTDGVAVGDFASVFPDAATVTPFVGRVTAVGATSITVSLSVKSGTAPIDGTTNTTLKIGGAWVGPSTSSNFPFDFLLAVTKNTSGGLVALNIKNDTTYSVSSQITVINLGASFISGYSTTYRDGGIALIDGGTTGASYSLYQPHGRGLHTQDLHFQNNGATGNADGVLGQVRSTLCRITVSNVRGNGFSSSTSCNIIQCESYLCNQSNTAGKGGFYVGQCHRCISHDNVGASSSGFISSDNLSECLFVDCIASNNGQYGFNANRLRSTTYVNCDAYNNASHGILADGSAMYIENCNLIKNGGYGISDIGVNSIANCGFGSGTQSNTSGDIQNSNGIVTGKVTYPSDSTPWNNPIIGDFSIALTESKAAGKGDYTMEKSGYTGTASYPDIGAAQSASSGGGGTSNSAGPLRGVVR